MNRSKFVFCIILPVTILIIALSFGVHSFIDLGRQGQKPLPPTDTAEPKEQSVSQPPVVLVPIQKAEPTQAAPASSGYRIALSNGDIAVYSLLDEKKPIKLIHFNLSTLPAADQLLLKEGITLQTDEDLAAFLEDFPE